MIFSEMTFWNIMYTCHISIDRTTVVIHSTTPLLLSSGSQAVRLRIQGVTEGYMMVLGDVVVGTHILAVLQVVESGGKNIEIAVMTKNEGLRLLDEAEVEEIVAGIEAEKAAAEAAKKGPPRDQ